MSIIETYNKIKSSVENQSVEQAKEICKQNGWYISGCEMDTIDIYTNVKCFKIMVAFDLKDEHLYYSCSLLLCEDNSVELE